MERTYQNEIKIKRFGLSVRPSWEQMKAREIDVQNPDRDIPNNQIKTAKYTYLSFIPMNLMFQFTKLANAYFLIIGAMQMVNAISITNGKPIIFGPLFIVVGISMLKDFFEDYKCHKSDQEENNKVIQLFNQDGTTQPAKWQDLQVGDVIRVVNETYLPADIIVLRSSDPKGKLYVETKSLDGETNLKPKVTPKGLNCQDWRKLTVNYESPNPYLQRFNGSINQIPLSVDNFLLRGSKLMNTGFVDGVVAYTGHDTKIMLNSAKGRAKKSQLESLMNIMIIQIFLFQMIICFGAGLYNLLWLQKNIDQLPYLQYPKYVATAGSTIFAIFVRTGRWVLIFTNFVPISMLVSLEMVKFIQGMFMVKDGPTYTQATNIPMTVQSSNLNEELGQVNYIFSDKTGTLTQNLMDFKCVSVGGKSYNQRTLNDQETSKLQQVTNVDFRDKGYFTALQNPTEIIQQFMICLSVCHTIAVQTLNGILRYNAQSPDELALVNFASQCGYEFQGVDDNDYSNINIYRDPFNRNKPQTKKFKVLHVLEFSSARKRMSVIVKTEDGSIVLYTKGADSVIEKRLKGFANSNRSAFQSSQRNDVGITYSHLKDYARVGLRTLVLAKKIIPQSTYQQWAQEYLQACNELTDREEKMEAVQEKIEVDLELLGGTAIEDKLQDDIGQTISSLKEGGISIWVLTGDKVETAINIGKSCQLLDEDMKILEIDGVEEDKIRNIMNNHKNQLQEDKQIGVVVTGDALIQIMLQQDLIDQLMSICDRCSAIMCCRVSPKQKAEVVHMVRQAKPKAVTLAIGDGANDVNMITAAHVGVGIRGVEGQQAARASDYAIGQFKILRRLTLYHGRECYRRNSKLVTYNFYKNMLLVLPQFWWGYFNGFSAVTLYDPLMYQSYNLFYTALPIIMFAIFDQEFSGEYFENNPSLYSLGQTGSLFNSKVFIGWIASGTAQAFIQGFFIYPLMEGSSTYKTSLMNSHGYSVDIYVIGTIILGFSIFNSNFKIILFTNTYSPAIIIVFILSLLSYLLMYALISSYMVTADNFNTWSLSYGQASLYVVWCIVFGATTMIDLAITRWLKFTEYSNSNLHKVFDNEIEMAYQKQIDDQ